MAAVVGYTPQHKFLPPGLSINPLQYWCTEFTTSKARHLFREHQSAGEHQESQKTSSLLCSVVHGLTERKTHHLLMSRWRKLHASWMGDSWSKLDGDAVEKEVLAVFKVMTKTSKVLASRELPACSENCLSIKEEVIHPFCSISTKRSNCSVCMLLSCSCRNCYIT